MKTTGIVINAVCGIAAVGLAIGITLERQARLKLAQENIAYRQQLSRMDELLADNHRLMDLLSAARSSAPEPTEDAAVDNQKMELIRLRTEAEILRQQIKEVAKVREDTIQARATLEKNLASKNTSPARNNNATTQTASQLEILRAEYGTDNATVDVTEELRDRIRGDSLKTIASNNIKGDPENGKVKRLIVEYRFSGVAMTNEFQEGSVVVLPPE